MDIRVKDKHISVDNNPWAGLSSYEDPAKVLREGRTPKLFCGRDDESHNVAQLVAGNIFVTLYGKSGTGKTSLLNAGVFPRLRQKRYLPVSIRLSMDALDISFQQAIVRQLSQAVQFVEGQQQTIEVVPLPDGEQKPDYLWSYFARTRFLNADGQTLFPVIVLDQFEEVFRDRRNDAEALLRQIAYLMDESHALSPRMVDGQPYKYDFNFRFVASIREDDLYRLEDSIDNNYLPELKRCRYRLRSLTEQGARDAILLPGEGRFKAEEQNDIASRIIDKSRNEDGSISTNIISLLCSRIFVDFQRSGTDHITPSLVDSFLKGNPFEKFYDEATRGFSNREKSYIEDHLVDSTGRRNSIPEADFLLHVKNGAVLLEGERKILQRTSTSSDGGNYRVELIHDSFCEPLEGQRQKRLQRKRVKQIAFISILTLLIIGGAALIIHSMAERQKRMLISQSRFLAEKASMLVDEGDSYTARLLALEALPPNRPYTPEAEAALRKTLKTYDVVLKSYNGWIEDIAVSPDGKKIISVDRQVRLWDLSSGKCTELFTPEPGYYVEAVAFCPSQNHIAFTTWHGENHGDNAIYIYDYNDGRCINILKNGHTGRIEDIAYSKNGKFIASASKDNTVCIWDCNTGKRLHVLKGHNDDVYSSVFSPDGKYIVTSSVDKTIRIWDVSNGICIKTLQNPAELSDAQISPDGKLIVSGSWDNTIRVWDFNSGQCILSMKAPSTEILAGVYSVSISPDGKTVAAAYSDDPGVIRIWNLTTGECIKTLEGHSRSARTVVFSPDGEYIISGSIDETIRIWKVHEESEGAVLKGFIPQRNWAPCAKSAVFSPDSKHILVAYVEEIIRIWDANRYQCLDTLWEHRLPVNYAVYSPNGKYIASASNDNTIRIWNTQKKDCIKVLRHNDDIHSVNFSNDGNLIVSASSDSTAILWGLEDDVPLRVFYHPDQVKFAAFSPDDKYIATASWDGVVRIWNAETTECRYVFKGHTSIVYGVAFSPDRQHLASASGDGSIRIWNIARDSCAKTIVFGPEGCHSVVYSKDGKYLLISYGNMVKVLNAEYGTCVKTFSGHTQNVNTAFFSPDERKIVSASYDNNVIIWDFPPLQQLIDETRERFKNRPLTPEERRKYYLE